MNLAATQILLVDDDVTFTEVMGRSLQRKGFTIAAAHDAEQALEQATQLQPERILLDLNLPGPSGLITLPKLLQVSPHSHIIMLTAYSSIATAVEAIKLGARDYLCKPTNTQQILAAFDGEQTSAAVANSPLSVDRLEWEHIQKVLQQHEGNVSATAKALGMHRRTLQRKLQKRPVRQ